jgi:hypothetical protein
VSPTVTDMEPLHFRVRLFSLVDDRRGKRAPDGPQSLPPHATHGTVHQIAQFTGSRPMADKKTARKPGRPAPDSEKKQFLASMDPDILRRMKAAAALREKTASFVLEEAAKEWLDRHQDGKK